MADSRSIVGLATREEDAESNRELIRERAMAAAPVGGPCICRIGNCLVNAFLIALYTEAQDQIFQKFYTKRGFAIEWLKLTHSPMSKEFEEKNQACYPSINFMTKITPLTIEFRFIGRWKEPSA